MYWLKILFHHASFRMQLYISSYHCDNKSFYRGSLESSISLKNAEKIDVVIHDFGFSCLYDWLHTVYRVVREVMIPRKESRAVAGKMKRTWWTKQSDRGISNGRNGGEKRGRVTEKKKLEEREGKRRKKYKTLGKRERSRGYVQFRGRSCVCIVSRATRRRECKMRKNRSLGKVDRRETRSGEKNWTRGISLARYLPLPRSVSVELFARGPRMKIVTRSGASGENVFHARAKVPEEARPIGINDSRWNALLRSLIHVDSDRLWSHSVIFCCETIIWFLLSEC